MGVLEAKNTSHFPEDEPAATRGPIQCQGLMMCTGYKWAAIFVLYRGTELRCFLYAPDPATIAKIEADAIEFESASRRSGARASSIGIQHSAPTMPRRCTSAASRSK